MDSLLHLRVDLDHLVIQLRVVTAHDSRVPTCGDEDGLDTTGDRSGEDGADLEPDEEGEGHDDGGEATVLIVCGRGEVEVQISEERGGVTDEYTTEGENRTNKAVLECVSTGADTMCGWKTYVDKRVNATVLHHSPGVLRSRDVGLAVESNVDVSVLIEELHEPLNQAEQTSNDAENNVANHAEYATLIRSRAPGCVTDKTEELNDGDNETAKADGAEAVGQSAFRGGAGSVLGEVVDAEVPRSINTGDDGVDNVLDELGDPVHGEGDEGDETNDSTLAATTVCAVGVIGTRLPTEVNSNKSYGEPGTEDGGDDTSNQADHVHVAEALADVNGGGEHQGGERDSRDPRVKAESQEQAEHHEDDTGNILLLVQVEDGGADSENDVENAGNPNEDLGECASQEQIDEREDEGDREDNAEEDEGVGVEAEIVATAVDCAAVVALRLGVSVDGISGDTSEAEEGDNQLQRVNMCRDSDESSYEKSMPTRIPAHLSLYLGFSILNCWSYECFSSYPPS